jgi:hypothetical protein
VSPGGQGSGAGDGCVEVEGCEGDRLLEGSPFWGSRLKAVMQCRGQRGERAQVQRQSILQK